MRELFVQIKQREKGSKFRFLMASDKIGSRNIYTVPEDISSIPYSPTTLLDDGQWYYIENFTESPYCIPLLKEDFDSTSHLEFQSRDFEKIAFMCSYQDNGVYCFQNVTKAQLVSKRAITFTGEWNYSENSKIITIFKYPNAIFRKSENKLYFQKLSKITSIFPNIVDIYREATSGEIDEFLENDLFNIEGTFNKDKLTVPCRKKIALALNTLRELSEEDIVMIREYIKLYCNELVLSNENSFSIRSEDDLKKIIYGIEQQYYTKPISRKKMLANSVIPID